MKDRTYNNFRAQIEDREMEIKKKMGDLKKRKYDMSRDCEPFIKTLDSIYETIYELNVFLSELINKNTKNKIILGIEDLTKIHDKIRGSTKVLDVILEKKFDVVYNKNFPGYLK